MSFKAKTVLNEDIRVFNHDVDDMEHALQAVKQFIREKYQLKDASFSIQYEDDENDLITISTAEDLAEAYTQAGSRVLKLHVVPEEIGVPVFTFTTELQQDAPKRKVKNEQAEAKADTSSSEEDGEDTDEGENEAKQQQGARCGWRKCCKSLLQDLSQNEEFREEFRSFVTTFVASVQENVSVMTNQAFTHALSSHDRCAKHPTIAKLAERLPALVARFPMALGALCILNADNVGGIVDALVNMCGNGGCPDLRQLPPWIIPMVMRVLSMFSGFGGFPPCGLPPPPHPFGPFGAFAQFPPPPPMWGFPPHPPPHGPFGFGMSGMNPHCGKRWRRKGCCPFKGRGKKACKKKASAKKEKKEKKERKQKKEQKTAKQSTPVAKYAADVVRDDLTLPDHGFVLPGQVVIKTWLLKNSGSQDWPEGVKIKYCGRPFNPLINGVEFDVQPLKAGEQGEVKVMVQAPPSSGVYRSRWRLFLPNSDTRYGPPLKCHVQVVEDNSEQPSSPVKQEKPKQQKLEQLNQKKAAIEARLAKLDQELEFGKQGKSNAQELVEAPPVLLQQDQEAEEEKQVADSDDMDVDEQEQEIPVLSSNLEPVPQVSAPAAPAFPYDNQLVLLLSMGFNRADSVRLLVEHKGDVNTVVNHLLQR